MRRRRVRAVLLLAALSAACGGRSSEPPGPGTSSGFPPDLRGRRVLVLPVQQNLGVRGEPDAELAFGLRERDVSVTWIFPDEVEEAMRRSPGMQAELRGLPVGQFLMAEVERVGDPLYGNLRRLSTLVDADAVLLPVQISLEREPGPEPTVRVWTALVEVRSGRVLWFSILDGGAFPADDPRGLASAVDVMARSLLWYAGV